MGVNGRANRNTVVRLREIDRRLKSGGFPNIKSLAAELEVHPRTVERDIAQLRDFFHAPIAYDAWRKGYYYTEDFSLPLCHFSEGEVVALFLGQKLLDQLDGTPFKKDLRSLTEKVRYLLNGESGLPPSVCEEIVSFNIAPLRGEDLRVAENFAVLQKAVQSRKKVMINYRSISAGEKKERTVSPYHLRYYNGAWYLIGHCEIHNEPRIFALDRILSLKQLPEKYAYPPDFRLEEYLDGVWGIMRGNRIHAEIRFDAFQAKWIRERPLKPGEKMEELPDGSLILYCEASGMLEIEQWVLSFGCHAEALGPAELRAKVAEEVRKMGNIYHS
ncbi:MAG: helix-turn-helix transcriptional regulator [Bacillota bacterium]